MSAITPSEILGEWLGRQTSEARVAVTVDSDRFLADGQVLAKPAIVDPAGREWQLAVFRGGDLAFRLRFRDATNKGRTLIVLSRGPESTDPIDVSYLADILGKNECGEPLDLSVTAIFRRVAPKISFPVTELRQFKNELLGQIDYVEDAVDKLIQKWGKPDSWGRGQVAAMLLLSHHPEMNLVDIWPDETTVVEFLVHVVRLRVVFPDLQTHRDIAVTVIHEASREQVRGVLFWADAEPSELAAYLVLRDFAGDMKLQNPSTQLAGLQIFPPELLLAKMELYALQVIATLKKQPKTWAAVNHCAETFLTPRRAARVLELAPPLEKGAPSASVLLKQESPSILRQQLVSTLLAFFNQPKPDSLAWVPPLEAHPLLRSDEHFSDRARQCRAALDLLLRVYRTERRLGIDIPHFADAESLLDWYINEGQHVLELDLSHANHDLQLCADTEDELQEKGQNYLFGGPDEQRPTAESLKGRVLERLGKLDDALASFVQAIPEQFSKRPRSIRGFLRREIDVAEIHAGALKGRVWVLVFDGMRFDTWQAVVKPILAEFFEIQDQSFYCVLPSYTTFARTSLLAGQLPSEWRGFKGNFSNSEPQLFAVNMGLNAQEAKAKLRFVAEADTTKARATLNFTDKDATLLNVLIYPVSDDACHDFGGDLASFNNRIRGELLGSKSDGVRGILDDVLKRIAPQDTVLLSSDHGFVELLRDDSVQVSKAEADSAGVPLESGVHWRYIEGFAPAHMTEAIGIPVGSKMVWVAPGRRWFSREGAKEHLATRMEDYRWLRLWFLARFFAASLRKKREWN